MGQAKKLLLWDGRVVERSEGAVLGPGRGVKEGRILMEQDRLWEVRTDNMYLNVLHEEGRFKLWYNPFVRFQRPPWGRETALAYAESRDGLVWEKPSLGLCPYNGTTANNLLARSVHGAGVFRDDHDPDASRRYKLVHLNEPETFSEVEAGRTAPQQRGLGVGFSADGLRWSWPADVSALTGMVGDTHNNAFWDERSGRYVCFTRMWDPTRVVARMESEDFLHWSEAEVVLRPAPSELRTYQPYAMPVFRYEDLYLGMAVMFSEHPGPDTCDLELAISTDTRSWTRPLAHQPLIPRGERGEFDSHVIFGPTQPIIRGQEMWLFYAGCNGPHGGIRETGLGLARLRIDGFAAWSAGEDEGRLTTSVLRCPGRRLTLNAEASKGAVRVEVLRADGGPVEGFEQERCRPIGGDGVAMPVVWDAEQLPESLVGQSIRLRLHLSNAAVYACTFTEG